MNRLNFSIIIYLIISMLVLSCGKKDVPVAEPEEPFIFKIQFALGDVKITGTSGEKAANQGDGLLVNDVITTGKKSVADLLYGKSGVIRISENSRIVVTSMAEKDGSDTVVNMDTGKVFCTLTRLRGTGFKVKTPTAIAAVRGTSFTVLSDKKGAKLSVVKGTVAVNPVKEGQIIEDKTIDVDAGRKTDYIDKKVVEKIIMGKMEIPVMDMTPAEKIEIQATVKEIKIDEIQDLSLEIREEIKKNVVEEPAAVEKKEDVKSDSLKKEQADLARKLALEKKQKEDETRKLAEEKLRQEEEAKRLAEEKKKKEEQVKKERASNIPTM